MLLTMGPNTTAAVAAAATAATAGPPLLWGPPDRHLVLHKNITHVFGLYKSSSLGSPNHVGHIMTLRAAGCS